MFITRDCRGSVWSKAKHTETKKNRQKVIVQASEEWVRVNHKILKLLQTINKEDWLHVKYEDLCNTPEAEMKRIFDFLRVEYTPIIFNNDGKVEHTIAGNKMRFSHKELRIKEDKAWQKNLTPTEISDILSRTKDMAKILNYTL